MDLIHILKERVIPIVLAKEELNQDPKVIAEKTTALSIFFPILLFILRTKPKLISSLQNNLNPRLFDLFPHDISAKETLIESIQQSLPNAEVENLLNHSIAPTLGVLEDLAGTSNDRDILYYLDQNRELIRGSLPVWALAILNDIGISKDAIKPSHDSTVIPPQAVPASHSTVASSVATPASVTQRTKAKPKQKTKVLLPLIAIILLAILVGLFLRNCTAQKQSQTMEQTQVIPNTNQELAFFQLNTNATGDLVTCQARIGNPTITETIQQEVKQLFNHPMGCGIDSSTKYAPELVDQNGLSSVLKLLRGTPNTTLTWTGSEIVVQGTDANVVEKLATQIKPLVPNLKVSSQKPATTDQTIDNSIVQAQKALESINLDEVRATDIATALNLQIINFASASNEIPKANKLVLEKAAVLINRTQNIHLTVKGYTDSVGNAASNKELSRKRAQAVVDYLVAKGVDPTKLRAEGYGQENPVADNSSSEGQFKNRRIEFEVTDTETGEQKTVAQ